MRFRRTGSIQSTRLQQVHEIDQVLRRLSENVCEGKVRELLTPSHLASRPIQVLIADDHAGIRAQMASQLAMSKEIEVVGQARDGFSAVALALCTFPDVALLDYRMPYLNGVEACLRLQWLLPSTRVVGWSSQLGRAIQKQFLEAGAVDCVPKSASTQVLRDAIRAAVEPEDGDVAPDSSR